MKKNLFLRAAVFAVLAVLCFAVFTAPATAEIQEPVTSISGLQSAINTANLDKSGNFHTITIGNIIDYVTEPLEISGNVTLKPGLDTTRLYFEGGYFIIEGGGTLKIEDNYEIIGEENEWKEWYDLYLCGIEDSEYPLIQINGGGKFVMNSVSLNTPNNAKLRGVLVKNGGTFEMLGDQLSGFSAENGAGVYVETGGKFTMKGGNIHGNMATGNGGGVYVADGGIFMMEGGTIGNNNEAKYGGGLYIESARVVMSGGEIHGNKATVGGGVYLNKGRFEHIGGYIGNIDNKNEATNNGGGVYVADGATLYLGEQTAGDAKGGKINGNKATRGGGVYVDKGGILKMEKGGIISNNHASVDGGGVYFNDGTLTMIGGTIGGSNQAQYGGGVYINGGEGFKMMGGTISGNKAVSSGRDPAKGGGVYINQGSFTMTAFRGSSTDGENTGDIISTGSISGNEAPFGSGVYAAAETLFVMEEGEITGNTAENAGAAVYLDGAHMEMLNGKITENKADIWGGVYAKGGVHLKAGGAAQITGNEGGNLFLEENTVITIMWNGISDNTKIGVYHESLNLNDKVCVAQGEYGDNSNYIGANMEKLITSDLDGYKVVCMGRELWLTEKPASSGGGTWSNLLIKNDTVHFAQSAPINSVVFSSDITGTVTVGKSTAALPSGVTVYQQFDLSAPKGASGKFTTTLPVSAVPAGHTIAVLHQVGGHWIKEPTTITPRGETLTVTASFNSLSPFAIVFEPPKEPEPLGSSIWLSSPAGDYSLYTATFENGGIGYFPDETFYGIEMPPGFSGDVNLKTPDDADTGGLQTYKTVDISTSKPMENGNVAVIKFKLPEADIQARGFEADEVHLYHLEGGVWVKLKTVCYTDGGIVYGEAKTVNFSPFTIVFEDTIPVTDLPQTEPEPTKETETAGFGIIAVLTGVAVAAVRKR